MLFYITQATLEVVGGISWWMLSKTSNLIYKRIYPKKELVVDVELKQLEVYIKELILEVKNQGEEIKLLKEKLDK